MRALMALQAATVLGLFAVMSATLPRALAVTTDVQWMVPANGQPYPDIKAKCGDNINFIWSGGPHAVFLVNNPAGGCPATADASTGQMLADPMDTGNYAWKVPSAGTFLIGYPVDGHCNMGQHVTIMATC